MIGNCYWSTGVSLKPCEGRWGAEVQFFDDGFCDHGSTEGTLRSRYIMDSATEAAELVVADARRLGITFIATGPDDTPSVYVPGDGEDETLLPVGWREVAQDVADALGWRASWIIGAVRKG